MAAVGVHGFRSLLGREATLRRFSRKLREFVLALSDHHARRGFDGCGLCSYSALYAVSGPFAANRIDTLQSRRCCLWCQAVTVARHLCLPRGGFVPASVA